MSCRTFSLISLPGLNFTTALGGVVTIAENGDATYDPHGQFEHLAVGESAVDSFDYAVQDDDTGAKAP